MKTFHKPNPNEASHMTVAYTDGACKDNPGRGGWGVWLKRTDGSTTDLYGGDASTTNNRMELMATIEALKHTTAAEPLQLWTDSSYVKNGITQWIHNWKKNGWKTASKKPVKNNDLWQQLDRLCSGREIDWQWIKGHAGFEGNEKADELANLGVENLGVEKIGTTNMGANNQGVSEVSENVGKSLR